MTASHAKRRQPGVQEGRRTRYRDVRENLFDLLRGSVIQNLEAIRRQAA